MTNPLAKHINLVIPDELHYKFKCVCATDGSTMKEVILDYIESYVKSYEGENRWKEVRLKKARLDLQEYESFLKRVDPKVMEGLDEK